MERQKLMMGNCIASHSLWAQKRTVDLCC
uniref:Uncharacterized protein n=1 Tax=Anguilla anguilla TaxID=7936 RepID=A0A0E9PAT7_ANGAN